MARIIGSGTAPVDFLALGDSYTIGEGVEDEQRWPVQLAAALRARGVAIAHPQIIARSGWTTDELSAAIDAEDAHGNLQPHYDLVSLQIGVNNQYRGRSVEDYRDEFSRLFERAVAFAGGDPAHVLVLSIPDWGTTPFAQASGRDRAQIAREIDEYNDAGGGAVPSPRRDLGGHHRPDPPARPDRGTGRRRTASIRGDVHPVGGPHS